jgi:hypothetical protein
VLAPVVRAAAPTGDDPPVKKDPPKPWRPYKDVPEVLFFDSFEGEGPGIWTNGSVQDKVVQAPGTHSLKMVVNEEKDQSLQAEGNLGNLGAFRLPGGLRVTDIKFQFMIWAENVGKVTTYFGDDKFMYQQVTSISKAQTWTTVTMDLAEFSFGHATIKESTVLTKLKIVFVPQHAKPGTAYIDDVVISNAVKPVELLPRVLAIEAKRAEVLRMSSRDGFSFNYLGQELLQNAIKSFRARKKAKTVLVIASRPEDAETYKAALTAAQTKVRGADFRFVFAEAPDGSPVCGLNDMHTLLQYNLQKSEAELAFLILGPSSVADGFTPGSETVRVIQERALESGVVPVVCAVPPNITSVQKDRTNLDRLYSAVLTASKQTGAPWVDMGFAYKDNAAAIEKGDLSAVGVANLAELAIKALKHVDQFVLRPK